MATTEGTNQTPAERESLRVAENREAAATTAAEEWEARAMQDEAEIAHLRALVPVLERTTLPVLDPERRRADDVPDSGVSLPDWTLPAAVVAASTEIDDGIVATREWADVELAEFRDLVEA